jgi:hypothetical protein
MGLRYFPQLKTAMREANFQIASEKGTRCINDSRG